MSMLLNIQPLLANNTVAVSMIRRTDPRQDLRLTTFVLAMLDKGRSMRNAPKHSFDYIKTDKRPLYYPATTWSFDPAWTSSPLDIPDLSLDLFKTVSDSSNTLGPSRPSRAKLSSPRCALSPLLFLLPLLSVSSAQAEIECEDNDLTAYLLLLIDTTYDNGLTIFEQFIAALSESDAGYTFLESLHESETAHTLLAPTDEAFNKAGIAPPFSGLSETQLVDLLTFHTLSDTWTYDKLPQSPAHAITSSQLGIKAHLNSTVETSAKAAMVLQQGDGGNLAVRLAVGNGTTWNRHLDLGWAGITNLIVLPIDTILPYPPKLSTALTLATSSRSVNGTENFAAALTAAGGTTALDGLTKDGFTMFVPVDDAFTTDIQSALSKDAAELQTALGNHYTTSFSLYSGFWDGQAANTYTIKSASGLGLTVSPGEGGATVTTSNGVSATILRADIPLENGVMHLIDRVLFKADQSPTTLAGLTPSSSAKPTGRQGAGSQTGNELAAPSQSGAASRGANVDGSVLLSVLLGSLFV